MPTDSFDLQRPYLVIPKLIKQPTWGGAYIVEAKGWGDIPELGVRIGQSYELFSKSNLSLLTDSSHEDFQGELTDSASVDTQTNPPDSVALAHMVASDPERALGARVVAERGSELKVLLKFTQALGNSFQTHIKSDAKHAKQWKPKPEAWYYFEPGILTLGVKPDVDWDEYRAECELIETRMKLLGQQLSEGLLSYDTVKRTVEQLLIAHNPWRFVNVLPVAREQLVDLSAGGIHHSWEEDPVQAPLGNVLYEIQAEAMDNVSTFRSFDKGKIASDGVVRPVQIEEYFRAIDRSSEANDPLPHLRSPEVARRTDEYLHEHLLASRYYRLDKLTLHQLGDRYTERINGFRHLFAKCGSLEVKSGSTSVMVSSGHSCFVPAAAESIEVVSRSPETEVLVTS